MLIMSSVPATAVMDTNAVTTLLSNHILACHPLQNSTPCTIDFQRNIEEECFLVIPRLSVKTVKIKAQRRKRTFPKH